MPARFKDAVRLAKRPVDVGHVSYAKRDRGDVEACIFKRQNFGVAASPGDAVDEAPVDCPVAPDIKHVGIAIANRDRFPCASESMVAALLAPIDKAKRNIPSAASNIEQFEPRAWVQPIDQPGFPGPVYSRRHQVIHQIVAARYAVKNAAYKSILPRFGNLAKAEVSGILCFLFKHLREHSAALTFALL